MLNVAHIWSVHSVLAGALFPRCLWYSSFASWLCCVKQPDVADVFEFASSRIADVSSTNSVVVVVVVGLLLSWTLFKTAILVWPLSIPRNGQFRNYGWSSWGCCLLLAYCEVELFHETRCWLVAFEAAFNQGSWIEIVFYSIKNNEE